MTWGQSTAQLLDILVQRLRHQRRVVLLGRRHGGVAEELRDLVEGDLRRPTLPFLKDV